MDKLRQSVTSFISLENLITDGNAQLFHKVVSGMHDLCFHILEAERNGRSHSEIEETIKPARDIHSRSVFVKRMQDWPRKYPGDFETVEYICNLENRSTYGKVEYYIEEYALNSAMAQQHRNKVQRQSEIILDALLNGGAGRKILSVGCGGSWDFLKIKKYIHDVRCEIVLHDIDSDALELSRERLNDLSAGIHLIKGNFLQSLRTIEMSGPFDVILAGGLFDYLSDKHISFFLKHAFNKMLNQNGILFFTNIKKGNPYKVWQEYLADWKLIYRGKDEIIGLLTSAGFSTGDFKIEKDETGLTFLVTAQKPG
ncbi:MAG: class I SAM-dependent methyltransferase [Nitrospirae bacterium]|nr:class I SAM-dependent methyltransferase [Nitrospirota bacterium]